MITQHSNGPPEWPVEHYSNPHQYGSVSKCCCCCISMWAVETVHHPHTYNSYGINILCTYSCTHTYTHTCIHSWATIWAQNVSMRFAHDAYSKPVRHFYGPISRGALSVSWWQISRDVHSYGLIYIHTKKPAAKNADINQTDKFCIRWTCCTERSTAVSALHDNVSTC